MLPNITPNNRLSIYSFCRYLIPSLCVSLTSSMCLCAPSKYLSIQLSIYLSIYLGEDVQHSSTLANDLSLPSSLLLTDWGLNRQSK